MNRMQEKYTKKAFDVLQRAKEAAAKLGNEYIGTEHILLGLTLVQQSVAAKALEGQNVTYHQVMERICEMQGEKQKFYLPLDMTPRAKRVVERSKQEAVRLGANYVGTEHILLALLREPDTLAHHAFGGFGRRYSNTVRGYHAASGRKRSAACRCAGDARTPEGGDFRDGNTG